MYEIFNKNCYISKNRRLILVLIQWTETNMTQNFVHIYNSVFYRRKYYRIPRYYTRKLVLGV